MLDFAVMSTNASGQEVLLLQEADLDFALTLTGEAHNSLRQETFCSP
jgi:hypothetical protein